MKRNKIFLAMLVAISLVGCKKEEVYVAPDSSFGLIYDKIFVTSCALSGCHLGPEKKKDAAGTYPILNGADTHGVLFNGAPSDSRALNAGLKLVSPGDPEHSFLYQKMIYDSSAFQFGSKMPSGGLLLTANQIKFVRQWIVAGAPLTGHVADQALMQ